MADLEYGKYAPKVYSESRWLQCGLMSCGNVCCVFLGLCGVAWLFHAIPTQWGYVSDMPSYGKTLLWASLAHHTDAYSGYRTAFSPPPPSFSRRLDALKALADDPDGQIPPSPPVEILELFQSER